MGNKKVAVLVDAGYFCAQASEVVFGHTKRRDEYDLNEKMMALSMEESGKAAFQDREVLRVYWYDAPPSRGQLSMSQEKLGMMEGVKLRLGKLNGAGQQKLVDALICRDIEELARNGAVDSILLVSGDEDLTLAIEYAQNHGVQVKLLGVGPGHASIGQDMAMLSDGVRKMGKDTAAAIVSLRVGGPERPAAGFPAKKHASKGKKAVAEKHSHGQQAQQAQQGHPPSPEVPAQNDVPAPQPAAVDTSIHNETQQVRQQETAPATSVQSDVRKNGADVEGNGERRPERNNQNGHQNGHQNSHGPSQSGAPSQSNGVNAAHLGKKRRNRKNRHDRDRRPDEQLGYFASLNAAAAAAGQKAAGQGTAGHAVPAPNMSQDILGQKNMEQTKKVGDVVLPETWGSSVKQEAVARQEITEPAAPIVRQDAVAAQNVKAPSPASPAQKAMEPAVAPAVEKKTRKPRVAETIVKTKKTIEILVKKEPKAARETKTAKAKPTETP